MTLPDCEQKDKSGNATCAGFVATVQVTRVFSLPVLKRVLGKLGAF